MVILWVSVDSITDEQSEQIKNLFPGEENKKSVKIISITKDSWPKNTFDLFVNIINSKCDEIIIDTGVPDSVIEVLTNPSYQFGKPNPIRIIYEYVKDRTTGEIQKTFSHFERIERLQIKSTML